MHNELADDTSPIAADKGQIRQVLSNLLDNALKFNRDQGSIRIFCKVIGLDLALSVEDTGCGIPPEDLPRIFERFYRVDKARSRELGGTGLGLSIVKHIVEGHGGTVSVQSVLDKGSVFTVSLPIYKETA